MEPNRKKLSGLRAAIIFIMLVVIGGFALAASGNLDNPFSVITQLTSGTVAGGERPALAAGQQGAPPTRTGGESGFGSQSDGFNWSQLGSVLNNLWFLMAASAVVMVIGRPIGLAIKKLQHLTTRPAAA